MSLCRFGEGDVYVFYDTNGGITCCGCRLPARGMFNSPTRAGMLAHLDEHVAAGHQVPADAFYRLKHPEEWDDPAE